ncbi:hypothetical protein L1987_02967 [Smallanthus sonchifolius]|uniref:Uncharacterized protein n=1 Tax=Smallanthus sonchifolius TaxID=185202 RepID=A0ACB9K987_9ASTR|nr:hypothetical protein L1987_02967 [Smallanthus sonchifolius]
MKNIWIYTIALFVLCLIICLSFILIFHVSGWRFLVFLTFNTALSVVIHRSSRSGGDDDLFEILIRSFTDEDEKSAPNDIDENKSASHDVEEDVEDNEDCLTQRVNDDLKRRSEEFIKRGKQRWRDEKERDRYEMKNK